MQKQTNDFSHKRHDPAELLELLSPAVLKRFNESRAKDVGSALPFIVAIDGRCASGKTTLALALKSRLEAALAQDAGLKPVVNLIHLDDFYLRPEQRTPERYSEPGGNVDRERFVSEVLLPLKRTERFCYRPFDCKKMALSSPVCVEPGAVALIEGSYCCHPALRDYYDLRIFLTVEPNEQLKRILIRNGESGLEQFKARWIPLEELYFNGCAVSDCCEYVLLT